MDIKIKYFTDKIDRLCYIDGKSDWVDLRAAETVELKAGEFKLIPLGVAMQLPKGYEAHVVPRSSTFKNFGIILTNSIGIIDWKYNGDSDEWGYPAYCIFKKHIQKGDRICQFRIQLSQKATFWQKLHWLLSSKIKIEHVEKLNTINRGGVGSTGKN